MLQQEIIDLHKKIASLSNKMENLRKEIENIRKQGREVGLGGVGEGGDKMQTTVIEQQ